MDRGRNSYDALKQAASGVMAERFSILHVISGLGVDQGGPSRSVPNQCFCTAAMGFRVGLAFVLGNELLASETGQLDRHGVKSLPFGRIEGPRALWRVIGQYDIVHVNGIWSFFNYLGCLYARMQHKPLVVTPHGMLEPWALSHKKLKKMLGFNLYQRRALQNASALQATAVMEAEHFRDIGLTNPVAFISNGVTIPEFCGKPERLKGGRRRLLFLSRIHPQKGVLELVRAVAALRPIFEKGSWVVTIAGPAEKGYLFEVKREGRKFGVSDLLEFPGAVEGDAKWNLYRSAELFVLPTYSENFGLVVAEALGCGVPVITTQGAPWGELLTRHCGWWPAVGQKDLEQAIKEALLTPPEVLAQMGERGRMLVREKYGWDFIGSELKDLYLWLLGERGRPSCVEEVPKP